MFQKIDATFDYYSNFCFVLSLCPPPELSVICCFFSLWTIIDETSQLIEFYFSALNLFVCTCHSTGVSVTI